jgi:hypothetical protein
MFGQSSKDWIKAICDVSQSLVRGIIFSSHVKLLLYYEILFLWNIDSYEFNHLRCLTFSIENELEKNSQFQRNISWEHIFEASCS